MLILLYFVYHFYKKFTVTKEILKYETSDIRNMSNIPRSEAELKTIVKQVQSQKYSSLAEEGSTV